MSEREKDRTMLENGEEMIVFNLFFFFFLYQNNHTYED